MLTEFGEFLYPSRQGSAPRFPGDLRCCQVRPVSAAAHGSAHEAHPPQQRGVTHVTAVWLVDG